MPFTKKNEEKLKTILCFAILFVAILSEMAMTNASKLVYVVSGNDKSVALITRTAFVKLLRRIIFVFLPAILLLVCNYYKVWTKNYCAIHYLRSFLSDCNDI